MLACLSEEPKNGVLQFVIRRHTANMTYLWLSLVRLGLFKLSTDVPHKYIHIYIRTYIHSMDP